VRVDTVVREVVEVRVEEGLCSPWQTYRLSGSAAPALPSPKKSIPAKIPQEKGRLLANVVGKSESSAMLLFASVKHAFESGTSS